MQTTWILVADASRARIFEKHQAERHLREIEDFVNPAGRVDSNDLRSDERGRFYGKGERDQAHTADPHVFPVEHENEMFALALARRLDQARNAHRYQRLCLIAAPKFLGLIRGNLNKEVRELVGEELAKDISSFKLSEIESYLKKMDRH